MIKTKRKWDKIDIGITIIFFVFFGSLLLTGEPLFLSDSFQHENQFVSREPVYALWIQLLRAIFFDGYRWVIIIIQNLLAAFSYAMFTRFLRREYKMPVWAVILSMGIIVSPHIITPIVSATHMVITNSILSEGISFSLYLYFVKYMLLTLNQRNILGKTAFLALGWAFLLTLVRGQLLTLFIVWVIVEGLLAIGKKKYLKMVWIFGFFILSFALRLLLICSYNYLEQGLFVNTVASKAMSVANVLYVSDREDGEFIADAELREVFYQIYDKADEAGLNYKFSPKGMMNRAMHHDDCHDALNFDYFSVNIRDYIYEKTGVGPEDYQRLLLEQDKVAASLQKALLPHVLGKYIYNYLSMCLLGFVRSIAAEHAILNLYALIMYIFYFIMMILAWKTEGKKQYAEMMALFLLMIVGNVTATALILQCISRYMLYNLPLFYIALLCLFVSYMEKRKGEQNGI